MEKLGPVVWIVVNVFLSDKRQTRNKKVWRFFVTPGLTHAALLSHIANKRDSYDLFMNACIIFFKRRAQIAFNFMVERSCTAFIFSNSHSN